MSLPDLNQFETHQQDDFFIQFTQGQQGCCQVKEINVSKAPANTEGKKQFSVVFSHLNPEVHEQGVYPISHPELGEFELFLVPVFGDEQQVHYEAVFT